MPINLGQCETNSPMESGMMAVGCSRCCCLLQQTCATSSPLALLAENYVT